MTRVSFQRENVRRLSELPPERRGPPATIAFSCRSLWRTLGSGWASLGPRRRESGRRRSPGIRGAPVCPMHESQQMRRGHRATTCATCPPIPAPISSPQSWQGPLRHSAWHVSLSAPHARRRLRARTPLPSMRLEGDDNRRRSDLSVAPEPDGYPVTHPMSGELPHEVVLGVHRYVVDREDHVAEFERPRGVRTRRAKSGMFAGPARHHVQDQHAFQSQCPRPGVLGETNPQTRPLSWECSEDSTHRVVHRLDRDRERNPRERTRRAHERGVDPDQAAAAVQQRSA